MRKTKPVRRRYAGGGLFAAALLAVAACGGSGSAGSGEGGGAASLEGETITFVVSFTAGGGYDIIARAIAPYLEDELGATVVVENEDGAGGLLAASQIFTAEPDGLTIGFFAGQGIAGATLAGAEGVQFEMDEFSYVGRLAAEPRVMITGPSSEYKTIEEIRSAEGIQFASAGTGSADNIDANVLLPVLGIDGRIVTGFEGSEETGLAITSGDAEIGSGTVSSRMPGIESGDFEPVLVVAEERVDELPDVPVITELDLDEKNMALAEAHNKLQAMGRMVWAPPNVPEDTLTALEDAFAAASENSDFQKQMEEADQPIDFTPGDEAKAVAEEVLQAPDKYKQMLKEAYANQ